MSDNESIQGKALQDNSADKMANALALMWLIVAKRTVQGAYKGELFVSPCIAGLANK